MPSSSPGPTRSAPIASASLRGELVGDAALHEEAVGGGARLATVAHLRDHRAGDGGVEVGVVEHEERRVAAELHRAVHDAVGRLLQQATTDLGRAGERQLAYARVVEHGGDDRAERRDGRTLTTPAGTPASASSAPMASAVSGVSDAGLSTTVQPAASAGPILRVAIAAGKFHGVISTLHPDRLAQHQDPVGAGRCGLHVAAARTASSAYQRKNSAA